jgi:hypothetical protein
MRITVFFIVFLLFVFSIAYVGWPFCGPAYTGCPPVKNKGTHFEHVQPGQQNGGKGTPPLAKTGVGPTVVSRITPIIARTTLFFISFLLLFCTAQAKMAGTHRPTLVVLWAASL